MTVIDENVSPREHARSRARQILTEQWSASRFPPGSIVMSAVRTRNPKPAGLACKVVTDKVILSADMTSAMRGGRKGVRSRSEAPFADGLGGGTPTPTPVVSQPRPARTANRTVDPAECFVAPLLPRLSRHQSHATRHPKAECFVAPLLPHLSRHQSHATRHPKAECFVAPLLPLLGPNGRLTRSVQSRGRSIGHGVNAGRSASSLVRGTPRLPHRQSSARPPSWPARRSARHSGTP